MESLGKVRKGKVTKGEQISQPQAFQASFSPKAFSTKCAINSKHCKTSNISYMSGRGSTGPTREECSSHSRHAARFFCRQQFEQRRLSSYPLNHPADQVSNLSGCKCKLLSAQASQLPYFSTKHMASPSQSVVRRGPG